jgi:hypothetical protein
MVVTTKRYLACTIGIISIGVLMGCTPAHVASFRLDPPDRRIVLHEVTDLLDKAGFQDITAPTVGVAEATGKPPNSPAPVIRVFEDRGRPQVRCSIVVEPAPKVWTIGCSEEDLSEHPSVLPPPMSNDAKAILRALAASFRMQFGTDAVSMPHELR